MPDPQKASDPSPGKAGVEAVVLERYGKASRAREEALCCPVDYDARYLEAIPPEIIERDYGCGDPSAFARPGDTVLDLGSGAGKIAYILSQAVGPKGSVLGVDFHDEMLALAREHQQAVGDRIGWHNVRFCKGRIQDLALDLSALGDWLQHHPVRDAAGCIELREKERSLRREQPMIGDESVDLIVSNCVLNLVDSRDKEQLFGEMYRVLRRGGRVAISDIVSDEEVPERLRQDPELWSGCISGAFHEAAFLRSFEEAGFHGIALTAWSAQPFAVVEEIEFRSVTVTAHKGKEGPSFDRRQAVLYRGPYRQVSDDDGQVFPRGVRVAVCDKTFGLLQDGPYAADFIFLEPPAPIAGSPEPFDRERAAGRHPRETRGGAQAVPPDRPGDPDGCC